MTTPGMSGVVTSLHAYVVLDVLPIMDGGTVFLDSPICNGSMISWCDEGPFQPPAMTNS